MSETEGIVCRGLHVEYEGLTVLPTAALIYEDLRKINAFIVFKLSLQHLHSCLKSFALGYSSASNQLINTLNHLGLSPLLSCLY